MSKTHVDSAEKAVHVPPKKWSMARKLVVGAGILLVVLGIALGVGLGVGLTRHHNDTDDSDPSSTPQVPISNVTANTTAGIWQPAVNATWQLLLLSPLNDTDPAGYDVWDIDLFYHNASTIQGLQARGAKVICYFSAGSFEDWRPDAADFPAADLGNPLSGWPGERWLNVSSAGVRAVMLARLDAAAAKRCDGIDPDNVDGYDNAENGLGLTRADAVEYVTFLAAAAHARNLSIGLKNAGDIVPDVLPLVQWSVNEQCQQYGDCEDYAPFPEAGKPVFNVEYPKGPDTNDDKDVPEATKDKICSVGKSYGLSSIIKNYDLDLWIESC